MIFGIGIDIIEIDRIRASCEKYGDHFLKKIFTNTELDYSLSKKNKYQHLAARFAAKEAISKAFSTGMADGFQWKDIDIYNNEKGRPQVNLHGRLKKLLGSDRGLQITMSHSDNYVACFAIIYKKSTDI